MKILVTGASGFIGSHFIKYLLTEVPTAYVIGFDKFEGQRNRKRLDNYWGNSRLEMMYGDLTGDISDILEGVDVVVHFAAKTFVDHSFRSPESHLKNNIYATYNLLEEVRKINGYKNQKTVYVHVSTDEVYGQLEEGSFNEESPLNPTNPYSATKSAGDMLVLGWCNSFKIPFIITRTENNYGSFQHPQKVMPVFIKKALAGEPLPVYGDGKHKRMWLHVYDHCSAIWFLVNRKCRGIYNIGGNEELENIQLANVILSALDKPNGQITFIPDSDIRPIHDRRYAIESMKLQSLGWRPSKTIISDMEEVIKWYADNQWWLE